MLNKTTYNSKKLLYAVTLCQAVRSLSCLRLREFVLMLYISFNNFSVDVEMFSCLPASSQDLAEDKMSCYRTQYNASSLELVTLRSKV